jgi:tetratricopeptide (TPR) repeat protein
MSALFTSIAVMHLLLQASSAEPPRAVVAAAMEAVEGDSSKRVAQRWAGRLAANPGDRAAALALATIDRLEYRYRRADSLYQALDDRSDAYALYAALGRVRADLLRGPFDSTLALALDVAARARATGDPAAAAQALGMAGFLASRLGALPQALDTLTVAERLAPAGEPWLRGVILCTRAPILSYAGHADAWATGQRGLAIAQRSGIKRVIGFCYQALSVVAVNVADDPALAEAYADSAEVMQVAAKDGSMLALTTFNRGYNRWVYSDLAGSRRALSRSIREGDSTGSTLAVAWSTRWLSAIYWQAGDPGAALQQFAVAETLFTRLKDGFGLANIRNGKAVVLLATGRLDEAERIFRQNLEGSRQLGLAEGVYANTVSLAAVHSRRGDWSGARQLLEQAIAYGNANGQSGWTASLGYDLGVIALRLGELDRAERYLLRAGATTGPGQYMDRYAIRARLAEVAARRGNLDRAVRGMESAARQLDSLRDRLDDRELKLLVFQTRTSFDEPDLGLAAIAERLVRGGRSADAFRLAEQRRARTLADQLLKAAYLRGNTASRPAPAGLPDLAAQAGRLPAGTAVIEYLAGHGSQATTAYLFTATGVTGVVLPPVDSLSADIERFGGMTERGIAGAALGARLSQALLLPVLGALPAGVTNLIVIPDRRLHRVPFDALPLDNGRPVVSRFAVSRAPSAVIALELLPRADFAGPPRLLALADPRFAGETPVTDPETEIYRSGYDENGGLPRLLSSREEAWTVARFAPGAIVRLREDASEAYLKHAPLDSFQILHLATHALVDERSPGRSSLALAPGDGEDGFVGAGELNQLHLGAELVVLSACRTAGGALIGGEGVQGLTAPLLAAGARAVVATLWPIGDRRTTRLVEDLYRSIAGGATAGEALRQAKLSALSRGESSAVWAAFTLVGDPGVRLKLVTPRPEWPMWFGLGAGVIIAAGLLLRRRRSTSARPG